MRFVSGDSRPAISRLGLPARLGAALCLGAVALGLSGCGKKQSAAPPPPQVGVITLSPTPVARTTDLPGRTTAYTISEVIPQVSGIILKRLFVEGSAVTAGQQLYQIDPATYQATYDADMATLARDQAAQAAAQAQAERDKPLAAAQAISQQTYDNDVAAAREAAANVAAAKAAVEQARINLQYTKVLSPISGTIGASSVTQGALVTADQATPLTIVTQLDPIYVDLNESSTTWLRLKQEMEAGQLDRSGENAAKVTLTLEDGSTYSLPGRLQFSAVNVDPSTGTVLVRALFPNPQHLLLPGMYVHAELAEGIDKGALLVPEQAVSHNTAGEATVLVVDDKNIASLRVITTSGNLGNDWIVSSGLQAGERVVVDGLMNATVGQAVTPVDETASFAARPSVQP